MSWFKTYLWVMAGGAVGTACRMGLSNFVSDKFGPAFPTGTVIVNITGCFVIGFFAFLTGPDSAFLAPPLLRQTVMIGFLGGYTTFSSFSLQTLTLLNDREWRYAVLNVVLSVTGCLLAAWVGMVLGRHLGTR